MKSESEDEKPQRKRFLLFAVSEAKNKPRGSSDASQRGEGRDEIERRRLGKEEEAF